MLSSSGALVGCRSRSSPGNANARPIGTRVFLELLERPAGASSVAIYIGPPPPPRDHQPPAPRMQAACCGTKGHKLAGRTRVPGQLFRQLFDAMMRWRADVVGDCSPVCASRQPMDYIFDLVSGGAAPRRRSPAHVQARKRQDRAGCQPRRTSFPLTVPRPAVLRAGGDDIGLGPCLVSLIVRMLFDVGARI